MKTTTEILATVDAARAALPKSFKAPELVQAQPKGGMLRVTYAGHLVGEWGHGVFGWLQVESAASLGREGQQVYRAVKKVLKANP